MCIPRALRSLARGLPRQVLFLVCEVRAVGEAMVLSAFAKFWKVAIKFVVSVCPSVHMEQLGSNWTDFHEIWYLSIFRKSVEVVQVSIQTEKVTDTLLEEDGFGGLVVTTLASGTQVCGFKPGRSRWIFTGLKIFSMPSSGGEVKESVPCRSLQHVKEPSNLRELQIAS